MPHPGDGHRPPGAGIPGIHRKPRITKPLLPNRRDGHQNQEDNHRVSPGGRVRGVLACAPLSEINEWCYTGQHYDYRQNETL